jgi:hypothetical protein
MGEAKSVADVSLIERLVCDCREDDCPRRAEVRRVIAAREQAARAEGFDHGVAVDRPFGPHVPNPYRIEDRAAG